MGLGAHIPKFCGALGPTFLTNIWAWGPNIIVNLHKILGPQALWAPWYGGPGPTLLVNFTNIIGPLGPCNGALWPKYYLDNRAFGPIILLLKLTLYGPTGPSKGPYSPIFLANISKIIWACRALSRALWAHYSRILQTLFSNICHYYRALRAL